MAEGLASSWWVFVLLGICAGILSGVLGIGSGIVFVPVLVLLLLFPQKSAQGMSLAAMVPAVLVGAIRYKMNPEIEINMSYVGLLALGAVAGALVGAELVRHLPGSVLRKVFAIVIILAGIRMLMPPPRPRHASAESTTSVAQSTLLQSGKENTNVGK